MPAHTERTEPSCVLPLDIVFALLEHLPPAELLVMARTCKTLHGSSIRALLLQGVTVASIEQLRSFCAFVQAGISVRAPLIRSLDLRVDIEILDRKPDDVPLPVLFQHLNALEVLHIMQADSWLNVVDGLDTALAELTTLRTLHVQETGIKLHETMNRSKSQLVEIGIEGEGEPFNDYGEIPDIVNAHHTTLERLIAQNCVVYVPRHSMVFPRMRALTLRNCEEVDLSFLYFTFPSLRYLELSGTSAYSVNRAQPLQHGSVERPWLGLEHVCGSLSALCRLPLSRHTLKHLDVDHVDSSPLLLKRLHTLIAATSPSRLMVRAGWQVKGMALRTLFSTEKVAALLDVHEAASITQFVLDILVHLASGTEGALLEGISTLLSSRPSLVFFALQLDSVTSRRPERRLSRRPPWDVFEPASQAAIARRLAASSPGLRHIFLSAVGCPPRYWSIDRVAEETVLTELESMVGRELVRAEGLVYYDRWFKTRSPDPC